MAATINADNGVSSGSSGLKSTADTSGVLALQSNGTTGLTLNTSLALGVGSSPSYGTSGQVLTSAGSAAAPTWTTAATSYIKSDLTPYDATLSLPSAIGTYRQYLTVSLTATTELMILWGSTAAFAAVWDNTTKTFGTPVLVRTAAFSGTYDISAYGLSSTSVLVCSLRSASTALETVVLSISGTTITVNTAVATTLAATSTLQQNPDSNNGVGRILLVGSSYVLNYTNNLSYPCFRAITVSGVTPTIGSELSFAAGTANYVSYVFSSSVLIHISSSSTVLYAVPVSVSGTTLTQGTQATTTLTNANITCGQLSSNRIAVVFVNTQVFGGIISITGTTASINSASSGLSSAGGSRYMQIFGLQAIIVANNSTTTNEANVLTDSSGSAVCGTPLVNPLGTTQSWTMVGCNASEVFVQQTSNANICMVIGVSGNEPSFNKLFPTTGSSQFSGTGAVLTGYPGQTFSNFENGGTMRTATYKTVTMATAANFFATSFNGTSVPQIQQAVGFTATGSAIRSSLSNAACWMSFVNATAAVNTTVYFRRVELA